MKPYALIDLHCDTLTDCSYTPSSSGISDTIDDPARTLSLSNIPKDVHWAQFFAIYIPNELSGLDAVRYYEKNRDNFFRQMEKFRSRVVQCRTAADIEDAWRCGKTAAILTVENGSMLAGDINRVEKAAADGVRAITLVHNGENEIASGNTTDHGMSAFGREVVAALEENGIIADVSHLNDRGFEDFLKIARRPFAATHSNARSICGHSRNLPDDIIKEMVKRNCLAGLNYYTLFIETGGRVESLDSVYRHVEHFMELGADKMLALGSDFDGADLPSCLDTPQKAADLFGYFISKGMDKETAEGIMYQNALRFFKENMKLKIPRL